MKIPPELLASLASEEGAALVLDSALRIRHVNPGWLRQATAAGAESLSAEALIGHVYLDFVKGTLRALLERRFRRVLDAGRAQAEVLTTECNTPTHHQKLVTHLVPLRHADAQTPFGIVVLHSLVVMGTLSDFYLLSDEPIDPWRGPMGLLVQCGCCRRARDARTGTWRMNTLLVSQSVPDTSHGLCDTCLEASFADDADAE